MTVDANTKENRPASLANRALETGIQTARRGERTRARQLLLEATELDPSREDAWLWLAGVAATHEDALAYLKTALALNPDNRRAQEGLRWIQSQISATPGASACSLCGNIVSPEQISCPMCGHLLERTEAAEAKALQTGEMEPPVSDVGELAPSFVLSVEQAEAVDAYLGRMGYESEARCIILADVTGQLISEWGQTGHMNTQVLSALAAGELAATNEMARLVGEKARFKLLLHEGERQSVYLSDVGEKLILVIVFDEDTPIGLVRMALKEAIEELEPLLSQSGETQVDGALGGDFAQLLESELDASLEL